MTLDAPFYLAAGSCVIEDGTGATPYAVHSMQFPAPEPDGFDGYLPAVRGVSLTVTGATDAVAKGNLNALRRALVKDEYLRWRHGATGDVLECKIRSASVVETEYDPLLRDALKIRVALTITTDPHWLGPWSADTSFTVSKIPGHFDITGVPGEDDALFRLLARPNRYGNMQAVGIWPDPSVGYSYLDDYGTSADTSDANAYGLYKLGLAATGTLAAIGAAPAIDTNDNRGRHLVIVRADSTATTASSNTVAVSSVVTGHLIAASATVTEAAVPFASNTLCGIEVGEVEIPAGQVPALDTGGGYAAESLDAYNTTAASLYDVSARGYGGVSGVSQSFAVSVASLHTGVTLKVKNNAANSVPVWISLRYANADHTPMMTSALAGAQVSVAASLDGELRVTWDTPAFLPAATYCVAVEQNLAASDVDLYYSTASSYATWKMAEEGAAGWTASSTEDLYFKSHLRLPLSFVTTMPILAACSESSKTIALDYAQRIPLDYAAIVHRLAATNDLTLFYDGDTDTPYIADSYGIGPSILAQVEIVKPLRLKPGVVNRVVIGITQGDQTAEGITVGTYAYRPRYLSAVG